MSWSVKWRVSAMMFLQYAIWGAWAPFLWAYLEGTEKIPGAQVGFIFGLLALACILAPFTGGQIADRWVPTQKFLGVAHLLGGLCLVQAARAHGFMPIALWMSGFALAYAPTLALTNSLGFHHIGDEKTFGKIRVWGTIGWICAAFVLSAWRKIGVPVGMSDCLMLSGVLGLVMGVFCFFLPNTPPAKDKAADPWAFREAFVLLKNKNFLIFMAIAFVVTTELQFYYGPTEAFLKQVLLIPGDKTPMVLAVAQMAEIIAMAFVLRYALRNWGVRKTLAIGTIVWPLRYIVFALAPYGPLAVMKPLVIASSDPARTGLHFLLRCQPDIRGHGCTEGHSSLGPEPACTGDPWCWDLVGLSVYRLRHGLFPPGDKRAQLDAVLPGSLRVDCSLRCRVPPVLQGREGWAKVEA